MTMFFRRVVPFLIVLIVGFLSFAFYFVPRMKDVWNILTDWSLILNSCALFVGFISMIRSYWKKAMTKDDPNRWYSWVTLASVAAMTFVGLSGGITEGTLFNKLFTHMMIPLESTMFSLLAFFMASAAFRSFRLKNVSAGLLLLAAMIVMLAQVPLGQQIWSAIPDISAWIMDYPNVAAQRAILIGIAIGTVATAIKIILGLDRSVFSGFGNK